jgi:hypothetical protein
MRATHLMIPAAAAGCHRRTASSLIAITSAKIRSICAIT